MWYIFSEALSQIFENIFKLLKWYLEENLLRWFIFCSIFGNLTLCELIKSKDCPVVANEGWIPGGDPGPEPSPPHVAFSRASAIQWLGGRSIRRTCGYLRSHVWLHGLYLPILV